MSRIFESVKKHNPVVIIENIHAFPNQGVVGVFNFGRAKGIVEALSTANGFPILQVNPQAWKKKYPEFDGLERPRAKDKARELAKALYPNLSDSFARKKDDGRADAVLMGRLYIK